MVFTTSLEEHPLGRYGRIMPNVVKQVFPTVSRDGLELTLNLRPRDVTFFLEERYARCFVSRDEPGLPDEDVATNVRRLYRVLGQARPERFTSLALRTEHGGHGLRQYLAAYGTLVLQLNLERLGPELIIVNGDFKNVAYKIATEDDDAYAERITWSDRATVVGRLRELFANARKNLRPRIHGSYVEARLPRPLVLNDIANVYADPLDHAAVAAAERLCTAGRDPAQVAQ